VPDRSAYTGMDNPSPCGLFTTIKVVIFVDDVELDLHRRPWKARARRCREDHHFDSIARPHAI